MCILLLLLLFHQQLTNAYNEMNRENCTIIIKQKHSLFHIVKVTFGE